MKSFSPDLERQVRELALQEIRKSDSLWAEYKQRTKPPFLRMDWWMKWIGRLFLPFMLLGLPFVFSILLTGTRRFAEHVPSTGLDNSTQLTLALLSLLLIGFLTLLAGGNDRAYFKGVCTDLAELWRPYSLRVMAFLPIHDYKIRRLILRDNAIGLVFGLLFHIYLFGYLATYYTESLNGLYVTAGVLVLQILTIAAASVIVYAYSPVNRRLRQTLMWIGNIILIAMLFTGMGGTVLPDYAAKALSLFLYISPTGWVSAAYVHGYLEGTWSAWLFLIPSALLIGFGTKLFLEIKATKFSIKEFVNMREGIWYGVIENGFSVPAELPEPPPLFATTNSTKETQEPSTSLSVSEAEQRVLEGAYLKEKTLKPTQFLERIDNRFLSFRERTIRRNWLKPISYIWQLLALTACLGICLLVPLLLPKNEATPYWFFPCLFVFFIHTVGEGGVGLRSKLVVYYPVDFREVVKTMQKRTLFVSIVYGPVMIAYALIIAQLTEITIFQSFLSSMSFLVLMLGLQPIVECLKLSDMTNDTKKIRMWAFWLSGIISFGGASLLVISTTLYPSVQLACLAAAVIIGTSTGKYYTGAYHRGTFDLVSKLRQTTR